MTERRLALKIDVDTWLGTRRGVPRLLDVLHRHGVRATFLFSLGPDHTGRAIKRVFRKGFLKKVSRTSVIEHYGLRTLLYGTVLPGPDIGVREATLMRLVRDAGHEVGIHCWDHILWQDNVANADADWTVFQMRRAASRFEAIFGEPSRTHGAAGWQMNTSAYGFERELGFDYASDVRGFRPFRPVDSDGNSIGPPQIPTTLPTLDELIGLDGLTAENVDQYLLRITENAEESQVYTLHAELEGGRLTAAFEKLLLGWSKQGYRLGTCRDLFESVDPSDLPWHQVLMGELTGRSGLLAQQGMLFVPKHS